MQMVTESMKWFHGEKSKDSLRDFSPGTSSLFIKKQKQKQKTSVSSEGHQRKSELKRRHCKRNEFGKTLPSSHTGENMMEAHGMVVWSDWFGLRSIREAGHGGKLGVEPLGMKECGETFIYIDHFF